MRDISNLHTGVQGAKHLGLKVLSKDEETKVYRIRAPSWVHRVLSSASLTVGAEHSKAEALGWFLSTKFSQDDILALEKLQSTIDKRNKKNEDSSV